MEIEDEKMAIFSGRYGERQFFWRIWRGRWVVHWGEKLLENYYKDDEIMEKRMSDAYMMERRIVLMEMMTTVMEKRMSDGDSSTTFCEEQRSDQSTPANPLLLAILTTIQNNNIAHVCVSRRKRNIKQMPCHTSNILA